MFHFFFGHNIFLIKKEVNKLLADFAKKNGDIGIDQLDGENLKKGDIEKIVYTPSFFGDKKMIIIENLLIGKSTPEVLEEIIKLIDKTPEGVELYVIEYGVPDKRTAAYKKLSSLKGAKEFVEISLPVMSKMIKAKLNKSGIGISGEPLMILSEKFSSDLYLAENESKKIIDYCHANQIGEVSKEVLDSISTFSSESKVFNFIDNLSQGQTHKAFSELVRLRSNSEDDFYILSMIIFQFRNIIAYKDAKERGETGGLKMSPFVKGKISRIESRYTKGSLVDIYDRISNIDYESKTGTSEISLAIDLFVAKFQKLMI